MLAPWLNSAKSVRSDRDILTKFTWSLDTGFNQVQAKLQKCLHVGLVNGLGPHLKSLFSSQMSALAKVQGSNRTSYTIT